MSELRIDSLLNELVDGGEGMSNRAKFRALPIDDQIMGRIKRVRLARDSIPILARSFVHLTTTRRFRVISRVRSFVLFVQRRGIRRRADLPVSFSPKTQEELCTTPSQAGRVARKLRNRNEDTKITRRYPFYQDISPEDRRLLGLNGGKPACTFTHAATNEDSLPPPDDVPEVAFAGRSNVGKSSLINAITLSAAARSSDVHGKTQSLNFYDVSRRLRIVDMPGYGFAFAAPDRVDAWNRLIDKYLTGRANLKRVYVVIDARHGLKAPDREMLAFLSKYGGVSYQVVLNKTDLVKPGDLARRAFLIREELRLSKRARGIVDMASTSTGAGVRDFARGLLSLAIPEKAEDDGGRTAGGGGGGEADYETDDERESYGGEWKPNSGDASVAGGGKKARPRGWGSYAADDDDDDERPRAGGLGGEWKPGRGATPRPGGGRGGRGGRGGGRGRGGRGGGRGRAR